MSLKKTINLLPFERLAMWYGLLTSILIFVFWNNLEQPMEQLTGRLLIMGGMIAISFVADKYFKNNNKIVLFRALLQIALLPYWYPDIYEFNNLLPNLDHIFASLEQSIFGMQPSIVFSNVFHHKWFSEAIYFGYFAYYPMIVGSVLYSFFTKQSDINRLMYIIMGAFFAFYLLFIFIPVGGPQFYFLAIGMKNVAEANFYAVGDYFKHQFEIMAGPGYVDGFFYHAIELVQAGGERPIAAFPSSHVGVSTVLMLWASSVNKRLMLILVPVYVLLCCATVYIQAHYLIDVFAGWVVGALFYFVFNKVYKYVTDAKSAKSIGSLFLKYQ